MNWFVVCLVLAAQSGGILSTTEESVVSVYTNTSENTPGVYQQIVTNIAAKITSPIYRLFNFQSNTTDKPTARPFQQVELLETTTDNKIREKEELSPEVAHRTEQKKPEKFTLFTNYQKEELDANEFINNEIDGVDIEDEDSTPAARGPFTYVLEFFGSVIQLLWGGFLALFSPSSSRS